MLHHNTNLAATAEFGCHCTSNGVVNVGAVKDDEWSISAKFHRDAFDRASSLPQQDLPRHNSILIYNAEIYETISYFKNIKARLKHLCTYHLTNLQECIFSKVDCC